MNLPLTILLLACWTVVMWRYGKSLLFPPATLALVWTLTMFALWLSGDLYYPLRQKANEIVMVGVLAFSIGGLCAVSIPLRPGLTLNDVTVLRKKQVDRWLSMATVLFLLNIPLFYFYFKNVSSTIAPRESAWRQVRIAVNKANISGQNDVPFESYLLPSFTIIALVAVYEYADTSRHLPRTLLLVLLAGAFQLINGARSEVLLLMVSSVVILWLKRGGAPIRLLLTIAVLFLLVFTAGQISMNKYGAYADASLSENLPRVAEGFSTYWLGGIVAFDRNRQNPELRYGWDLGKFARRLANRLGAHFSEHDRNLEYTRISPRQTTNVYTAFLPYYMDHGGMRGVMMFMFLVGLASVYVYRNALKGNCWAVFTVGAFVYATAMTIFSEEFFAQVMFWIKAALLSTLIYFAPPMRHRLHSRGNQS